MSKMSREEKLFKNETNVLQHYKEVIEKDASAHDTKGSLVRLTDRYEALLNQTRFLTWISGRLERKLQRKNRELHDNNVTLQRTLNELTKAEAGRSTYAIIYFIAIVLFVLEELFLEPFINLMGNSIGYGILIKLGIVLILKISEGFIEKKIVTRRRLMRKKGT